VSEKCEALKHRCKEFGEELNKSLDLITDLIGESVSSKTSFRFTYTIGIATISSSIVASGLIEWGKWPDTPLTVALLVFGAVIMVSLVIFRISNRKDPERLVIAKAGNLYSKRYLNYFNIFIKCCEDLDKINCASEKPLYCNDLDDLKEIAEILLKIYKTKNR
jgi:hypothetical protein